MVSLWTSGVPRATEEIVSIIPKLLFKNVFYFFSVFIVLPVSQHTVSCQYVQYRDSIVPYITQGSSRQVHSFASIYILNIKPRKKYHFKSKNHISPPFHHFTIHYERTKRRKLDFKPGSFYNFTQESFGGHRQVFYGEDGLLSGNRLTKICGMQ